MAKVLSLSVDDETQDLPMVGAVKSPHTIEVEAGGDPVYYRMVPPRNVATLATFVGTNTTVLLGLSDGLLSAGDKQGFPATVRMLECICSTGGTATVTLRAGLDL